MSAMRASQMWPLLLLTLLTTIAISVVRAAAATGGGMEESSGAGGSSSSSTLSQDQAEMGDFYAKYSAAAGFRFSCFHCVNDGRYIDPLVKSDMAKSRDVFFWPIGVKDYQCHSAIDGKRAKHMQVCLTPEPRCVTITPNVPNVTFTVRGCLEQTLPFKLRHNEMLNKTACFRIRSRPRYSNRKPISYTVCVCGDRHNCNSESQPEFLAAEGLSPTAAVDVADEADIVELVRVGRPSEHSATVYKVAHNIAERDRMYYDDEGGLAVTAAAAAATGCALLQTVLLACLLTIYRLH